MEPEDFQHHSEDKQVDNQSRHDDAMLDGPAPAKVKEQSSIGSAIKEKGQSAVKSVIGEEPLIDVKQNVSVLEGESSFGSKVFSLFGKDSTFIQLQKKIDELNLAKTPEEKAQIKKTVLDLGNAWLEKHQVPKSADEEKKRKSIEAIVKGLSSKDSSKSLEIISMSDKITVGEKIKSAISGNESEFSKIQIQYKKYLQLSSEKIESPDILVKIKNEALSLHGEIDKLLFNLTKSKDENDIHKASVLNTIKFNLGKVQVGNDKTGNKELDISGTLEKDISGEKGGVKVTQNIVALEGKSSFFSNVKSFFGSHSTFIQLEKKIDELGNPDLKPAQKDKIKEDVLILGTQWLAKHDDPSNDNDKKKHDSIQKIVEGLKRETSAKSSKEASKKGDKKDEEIASPKEFEILSMKNKLTFGEKIKSAFSFNDTEFEEIEKKFEYHLAISSGQVTNLGSLFNIVNSTLELNTKIDEFKAKIVSSTNEKDKKKIQVLDKIKANMGSVSFAYNLNKNIRVEAQNIDISSALANQFQIEKAEIIVTFGGDKEVKGDVKNLLISLTEVSFESASITYNDAIQIHEGIGVKEPKLEVLKAEGGYEISASGILDVSVGERVKIESSGSVKGKYSTATQKWGIEIADCVISGEIDKIVKFKIENANYKDSILTASSASASFIYDNKAIEGNINDVTLSKEGVEWGAASLAYTGSISMGNAVEVENPSATIKGKKDNYDKSFKGGLKFNFGDKAVGAIKAAGDVTVTQTGVAWATEISNGSLSVNIINGMIQLDSSGIEYSNGSLLIHTAKLKLNAGLESVPNMNIEVSGKDITYTAVDGFDWEELSLGSMGNFSAFEIFDVTAPTVIWKGKKENYQLFFNDGAVNISSFNGNLTAAGKASLMLNYLERKPLEFVSANLKLAANSPDNMPGDFLPGGMWPYNFDFVFPVIPGVHAGFGLEFSGAIKLSVTGEMDYNASTGFDFTGSSSIGGKLGFAISLNAGVGIPNIAQLDAYASAGAEATAKATVELNSSARKKADGKGFDFSKITGNYNLEADAKAKIKAGIKASAFMIFQKKLYEVEIAEWEIGKGNKSGVLGIGSTNTVEKTNGSTTGFLAGNINSPFKSQESDYIAKLTALSNSIPKKPDIAPEIGQIERYLDSHTIVDPIDLAEKYSLARAVMDKIPVRSNKILDEIKVMEDRKKGQWLIREVNRQKRLNDYDKIKTSIFEIKAITDDMGEKIKNKLTPEDESNMTDFIHQYSTKLISLEGQMFHAKVNFENIDTD